VVEARAELAAPRPRLRLLDLLRLVAALSVVLFHYTARYNLAWSTTTPQEFWAPLSSVTAYGVLGVQLFFLISGFVVLMTAWGADMPRYIASRASRLYPAYWVGVILTGGFLFFDRTISIGGSWASVGPSGFLLNLTLFQSAFGVANVDGVYWTLWAELKFYALIGLLILVGLTRARVIALAVAWPILGAFFSQFDLPIANEILMPEYAAFFSAGMLLFVIYRDGWTTATSLALAFNWVVMMHYAFSTAIYTVYLNTLVPANPNVIAVAYTAFLAVIVAVTQTRLARIQWAWLTVAGALTYPLYLVHEVVGWWLISRLYPALPRVAVLLLVIAMMLGAAYLIHRFVEKPLGPRLRRSLEAALRNLNARPPAAASPVRTTSAAEAAAAPAPDRTQDTGRPAPGSAPDLASR